MLDDAVIAVHMCPFRPDEADRLNEVPPVLGVGKRIAAFATLHE